MISAGFLFLGNRPFSTRLIIRQCEGAALAGLYQNNRRKRGAETEMRLVPLTEAAVDIAGALHRELAAFRG
jgi:hypothetical protein